MAARSQAYCVALASEDGCAAALGASQSSPYDGHAVPSLISRFMDHAGILMKRAADHSYFTGNPLANRTSMFSALQRLWASGMPPL